MKKERKRRPPRGFRDDGGFTSGKEASWEKPLEWAQAEMGVSDDGTILHSQNEERLGIGASDGLGLKSSVDVSS